MKRLLSILGAFAIVGSGVTAVVACNSSSSTGDSAQDIVNKIKNKSITVPFGTAVSTSVPATITALRTALKKVNPSLTVANLKAITFSQATLVTGTAVAVTATVKVDSTSKTVALKVTLLNEAKTIINKITTTALGARHVTSLSVVNTATQEIIRHEIWLKNNDLTQTELRKITFTTADGNNLKALGTKSTIVVTVTPTAGTALTKNVTLTAATALNIKSLIKTPTVTIDTQYADFSSGSNVNVAILRKALGAANSDLSKNDLSILTFAVKAGETWTLGADVKITATITPGNSGATTTKELTVKTKTKADIRAALAKETSNLTIYATTGEDNLATDTATRDLARNTLLADKTIGLTLNDVARLTFTGTVNTTAATIQIKVDGDTATTSSFKIINAASTTLAGKITVLAVTVVAKTMATSNNITKASIKSAIYEKNKTRLTSVLDLYRITFNNVNLNPDGTTAVNVTATMTDGAATKTIVVTTTAATAIKTKIGADVPVPVPFDASTTYTISGNVPLQTAIKTKLKALKSLTDDELRTIVFGGSETLVPGVATNVVGTITVGSTNTTVTLKVTIGI